MFTGAAVNNSRGVGARTQRSQRPQALPHDPISSRSPPWLYRLTSCDVETAGTVILEAARLTCLVAPLPTCIAERPSGHDYSSASLAVQKAHQLPDQSVGRFLA